MEFAAGMLAAIVAFTVADRIGRWHAFLLLGLMVVSYLVATAPLFKGTVFPVRELGLSTLFGSLLVLVLSIPIAGRVFAWKPLAYLGYRSYSMFLDPPADRYGTSRSSSRSSSTCPRGRCSCCSCLDRGVRRRVRASGMLLFVTVERPCIDWAKRTGREPAPTRA